MAVSTVPLSAFLPWVLPHVGGCPRPTAEMALRAAAIEWCEQTNGWRHIGSFDLTENRQAIVAPAYATIHQIEEATLDGKPLTPTLFTDARPDELTGAEPAGEPLYLTQVGPNEVSVYPFRPGLLRVSLFLKPRAEQAFGTIEGDPLADANNVVPDFMLIQHAEKLAWGALARIFALPKQAFTDGAAADLYRARFAQACADLQSATIRGQQRAPMRTKPMWM